MPVSITIVSYDSDWPHRFEQEAVQIRQQLSGMVQALEHIGSTAVEGLGGKPIIDMMLGVKATEPAALSPVVHQLMSMGYCYFPLYEEGIYRDRRFLARYEGLPSMRIESHSQFPDRAAYPPLFHVHLLSIDSPYWKRHLQFRDYLRAHPIARDAYYRMKVKLARGVWESGEDYAQAKRGFIQRIERLAELGL
ncbi:GrpB family protein [Phaeodactylibacter luteus]|uniref:GrpB family protein n=1 Tax=Phaeodactylibacter luteus TaxID=1564516 RepID=A0A5C6RHG3_9BACT|nr:GrpB family protein [Phaeodactylibacter luteus]TXB61771.1 GrpB family protein [Phaeodactylibacter luteus]